MARMYTPEEKEFLKMYIPGHSYKEIREEFLKRFGGTVTKSFPASYIHNNGLNTGRSGRFLKGFVPANKGKKMSAEQYERCKPTMFKPGQQPHNTLPVGTEKMLSDGYVWVKIDDKPKVPKKVNWIQKHRLIYQQHYGEIPEGYLVIFLDGDHTNFDPKNLKAISKADNSRLNQNKLRFDEAAMTETGLHIARLKTAIGRVAK